jgi:hypothetical protein
LKAHGLPPAPERPTSWQTFVRAHWGVIAGADFFTTEVWTSRGLVTYDTVFVIDLASRRVHIVGSTPHPDALRRAVVEFVDHYHRERNHQGLDNALIAAPPPRTTIGRVHRRPRLGGLLNYYERAA